jgi:V/A-type H+-transporting ATPase subunit A
MVFLQQDAFDQVDASMPRQRQAESFRFLKSLIDNNYDFTERESARDFFTRLTSLYKNWNYCAPDTGGYERYRREISELAEQHKTFVESRAADRKATS